MKPMQIILLVAGIIVVLVALYTVYGSVMNNVYAPTADNKMMWIEKQDGNLEEEVQKQDPVSEDNSLDTIESEIDATVILEEDFSDL